MQRYRRSSLAGVSVRSAKPSNTTKAPLIPPKEQDLHPILSVLSRRGSPDMSNLGPALKYRDLVRAGFQRPCAMRRTGAYCPFHAAAETEPTRYTKYNWCRKSRRPLDRHSLLVRSKRQLSSMGSGMVVIWPRTVLFWEILLGDISRGAENQQ